MTSYLDTSLLVAALTNERKTPLIQGWLGAQPPLELAISDWVVTELSSVLSIKMRMGQIEASHRAASLALFARMSAETFSFLPISGLHYRTAARFANQHALGLRAGDALHLAVCGDHGATLVTLDQRLNEAGIVLGLKTELL